MLLCDVVDTRNKGGMARRSYNPSDSDVYCVGILGYLGGKARYCGEVCVASVWLSLIVCAVNQFAYTCGLQGRLKQESGSFP